MKVKSKKLKVKSQYKLLLTLLLFALFTIYSNAQQQDLPLNREWQLDFEKNREMIQHEIIAEGYDNDGKRIGWRIPIEYQQNKSSCFKPYIAIASQIKKDTSKSLFIRKLKKENLIIVNDTADKFHLTIDPLFNFEYGRDRADSSKSFYKNTRGVLVRGDIGTKFSFESSFYENQATFVKYVDDYIKRTDNLFSNSANYPYNVVPGQGRAKSFKKNGYDFAMASGYVSYSPSKHFNFQVGTGKHFVGDGYRSLLLSDNAFNYPFVRITSSFGKFQYTNLYASFMNLTSGGAKTPPGTELLFQKKAGNFQFLSWNANKRIQLGFFQGLIWQASDSMNRQHFNFNYFSPVIYNAALSEGLAGTNNVLLGWTLKFKITNSISLYGQYMLDDIATDFIKNSLHDKQGFQAGAKYFDLFGAKNLHLQIEYNRVRPYTYASENSSQSYTHYNQPLADPLGANFKEAIAFLNYRIGDFFVEAKINYAITGKDSLGRNYGNTIFNSDNNALHGANSTVNEMGQGVKTTLRIFDFHIGYLVSPSTNFNILVGISNRSSTSVIENSQTNFVYFGIRTSLNNVYYDF
jgi:hypothetical protein